MSNVFKDIFGIPDANEYVPPVEQEFAPSVIEVSPGVPAASNGYLHFSSAGETIKEAAAKNTYKVAFNPGGFSAYVPDLIVHADKFSEEINNGGSYVFYVGTEIIASVPKDRALRVIKVDPNE